MEYPYINPSFGDMPEHTVITLNSYTISDGNPRIIIFKADEFATYSEMTTQIISDLQLFKSDQPYPKDLPGTNWLKMITTNNTGMRYLTQVMTGYVPFNNEDIFYYYLGLSTDEVYFIEALLPVNVSFLPADAGMGTITPADGVLFPIDATDPLKVQQAMNACFREVTEKSKIIIQNT